jgi:GT2 family glycosyltransferase
MESMTDKITAVIACKDRDKNAQYCLASINVCNPTPACILVDYGSARPLKRFEKMYPWLHIIRVDAPGGFHKTRALNIGIAAVTTEYACLTDIDQIFQPNFCNVVLQEVQPSRFIKCKTHFAKQHPKFAPNKMNYVRYHKYLTYVQSDPVRAPHGEGCCQVLLTKHLNSLGGHDETYIGWGYEDKDLEYRARRMGLKTIWIDDRTSMVHLPHPRDTQYFNHIRIAQNKARFSGKKGNQ